jgi:hypothetical protein
MYVISFYSLILRAQVTQVVDEDYLILVALDSPFKYSGEVRYFSL